MLDPTSADHGARGAVHPRDPVQALPTQDPMHGRRIHLENPRDASRTPLGAATQLLDSSFDLARCPRRRKPRPARPIDQPDITFATPASPPLVRGLTRDPELISDMRDRAALLDPSDQQSSPVQIQASVSVQRSLRGWVQVSAPTPSLGGPSEPWTVNNVHGQHN